MSGGSRSARAVRFCSCPVDGGAMDIHWINGSTVAKCRDCPTSVGVGTNGRINSREYRAKRRGLPWKSKA